MKKIIAVILMVLFSCSAVASMNNAWSILKRSHGKTSRYPVIIKALVEEKLYFSSVPYIKEYLTTRSSGKVQKIDKYIDEVITHVGIKQFAVLPVKILKRSSSPMVRYILAKKMFRVGKYRQALAYLKNKIPMHHPAKPFAFHLTGSIYSILKKYDDAVIAYRSCTRLSNKNIKKFNNIKRKRQLTINKDYCTMGIARAEFAAKKFEAANLSFLDLPKHSAIWPEILFEEAWNSFYLRDYNRTLGKLVTYKAPVLNFIFNPEIDVLRALTYLELCLWSDTKLVVNQFYQTYQSDYRYVNKYVKRVGKDYRKLYFLAKSKVEGTKIGNKFLDKLISNILKDPAFQELYQSYVNGINELARVRRLNNKRFKRILSLNLKESLLLQRDLVGAYIRKRLIVSLAHLKKSFEGMSYIKLEVLNRKKSELYYDSRTLDRKRGDLVNLKRTEKQYFWTFNGEFWADELGDYVFALKSKCE